MDAHYHIVMKARDEIKDTGKKLYFAYSSALDRDSFLEWREKHSYPFFDLPEGKLAEAKNTDLIFNFRSRWWGGRVAGLQARSGQSVYGLLFEINAKDWPVVQHKEGFITGMCIEIPVKVMVQGQEMNAIAFSTNPERATSEGAVSQDYIDALVVGAKSSGLPADYINYLQGLTATH
jgi:gamma-glutamylcyclotransferase